MPIPTTNFPRDFLAHARHSLQKHHSPRIARCLKMLSEEEVWWRPHHTSNSVGNLVLHLEGNVRQWIIAGLGGKPYRRERDREFAELGPIPRAELLSRLENTVAEACRVLGTLSASHLATFYSIQGFRVTGLQAISHVTEHFAYHCGQIVFVTKLKWRKDLGFTRLPKEKPQKRISARLPAI